MVGSRAQIPNPHVLDPLRAGVSSACDHSQTRWSKSRCPLRSTAGARGSCAGPLSLSYLDSSSGWALGASVFVPGFNILQIGRRVHRGRWRTSRSGLYPLCAQVVDQWGPKRARVSGSWRSGILLNVALFSPAAGSRRPGFTAAQPGRTLYRWVLAGPRFSPSTGRELDA